MDEERIAEMRKVARLLTAYSPKWGGCLTETLDALEVALARAEGAEAKIVSQASIEGMHSRGGNFYKHMVTIPLDLLVEIRRMYGLFAKTHFGLSGDIARMDAALRTATEPRP